MKMSTEGELSWTSSFWGKGLKAVVVGAGPIVGIGKGEGNAVGEEVTGIEADVAGLDRDFVKGFGSDFLGVLVEDGEDDIADATRWGNEGVEICTEGVARAGRDVEGVVDGCIGGESA